jgi:V/A-type H+-transporting ATPase subunit G/H
MEDELQRLLDTELQAESLVNDAEARREQMISQALEDASTAEKQFAACLPDLRASFIEKAEERAAQTIAEQARRYKERRQQLQTLAEGREQEAIEAAVSLLLDPDLE